MASSVSGRIAVRSIIAEAGHLVLLARNHSSIQLSAAIDICSITVQRYLVRGVDQAAVCYCRETLISSVKPIGLGHLHIIQIDRFGLSALIVNQPSFYPDLTRCRPHTVLCTLHETSKVKLQAPFCDKGL